MIRRSSLWCWVTSYRPFIYDVGLPPNEYRKGSEHAALELNDGVAALRRLKWVQTWRSATSPRSLDVNRFREDLRRHVGAARVADDVDSAGSSGVTGTPTFFINGRRQYGAYDVDTLTAAVKTAKAQAKFDLPDRPRA